MPRCDAVAGLIARRLAGEIDPESGRDLDAHLAGCPRCSAEAARIRTALALLERDEVPDPGRLYWQSFGSRLRLRIAASARRRSLLRLAAAVAAVAVFVAGLAVFQVRVSTAPGRLAEGGGVAGPTGSPRALPIGEADARLDALLREAKAPDAVLSDLDAMLDEIAPLDTPDAAEALGRVPADEGHTLVEELLDGHG